MVASLHVSWFKKMHVDWNKTNLEKGTTDLITFLWLTNAVGNQCLQTWLSRQPQPWRCLSVLRPEARVKIKQDPNASNSRVAILTRVPKSLGARGDFEHFQSSEQHGAAWRSG